MQVQVQKNRSPAIFILRTRQLTPTFEEKKHTISIDELTHMDRSTFHGQQSVRLCIM